jgi:YgiT-type zinc finger domain-containing protein
MRCENCGKEGARMRRATRTYGAGDDLLVIENIPVLVCPQCGESYMTAETMHEIDRLKAHRHGLAQNRKVEVIKFEAA